MIKVDVPLSIRLRMDGRRVVNAGAKRIAKIIQAQIRAGRAGDGKPIRSSNPKALIRTGQLVASISADKARNTRNGPISAVRPTGFHSIRAAEGRAGKKAQKKLSRYGNGRGGVKRERPANRMIMAALQKQLAREIMVLDPASESQVTEEMRKEIERQVSSGTLRLEFRNLRGGL